MNIERKTLAFELKAASADGGEFEGLAAAFHNVDDSYWPDILAPGCFKDSLPEFLDSGFVSGCNHDWDQPIGKPVEAEETAEGLRVKASISDTTHGRDMRVLMRDGVIKRLSIGFRVLGKTWLEDAEAVVAYWQQHGYTPTADDIAKAAYGARLVTKARLYEFGPVAVPANKRAVISSVKSGEEGARAPVAFRDHSEMVLATVEEYAQRLRDLKDLRASDGRGLSPDHQAAFRRLHAELGQLLTAPHDAKGEAAAEKAADPQTAQAALEQAWTRFQATNARLLGVTV